MSEYTTRPRVRTVAASPQNASSAGTAAAAGLVLAGVAVAALLRAAGRAWNATRANQASAVSQASGQGLLHSPRRLREQFSAEERQAAAALLAEHRTPAEAMKLATAVALDRTPLHTYAASLEGPVAELIAARDVAAVEEARRRLLRAVERDHLQAFVAQLSEAAAAASRDAGFESIEVRPGADATSNRIIATDPAGRSLVSEVAPDESGEVNLATEAVGITDGTCHTALDRFDAALERRGVRSGPPRRVTTGGVCELAFAREFLRRRGTGRARRSAAPTMAPHSSELSRRRTQNNRPAQNNPPAKNRSRS